MKAKMKNSDIILPHGGYRELKGFQLAQLGYDITVRFVALYIDKRSRTCDQMVQAARSGMANIAEGSMASATSKKTELKLTNVAKASLEELLLDYEAFLRQNNHPMWDAESPLAQQCRNAKPTSIAELRQLMMQLKSSPTGQTCPTSPEVAANTMLTLINQCIVLLSAQIKRLESDFLTEGGFTERLYHARTEARKNGRGGGSGGGGAGGGSAM